MPAELAELKRLEKESIAELEKCESLDKLHALEVGIFGRKGRLKELLAVMKDLSPEERKILGAEVNRVKTTLEKHFAEKKDLLEERLARQGEGFDLTLPGTRPERGGLHPVTQMAYALNDAFLSLGFSVYDEAEICSEAYSFDSLNFPPDHPARESMDTYWLEGCENKSGVERLCLRPHLTGASVRYMQKHKPPFRFVYPGRVYRSESTDASHERAFYQYEALIVDREVPFSAGRLLVNTILERVFGQKVKTRMRAGFFPFVEPGFEIDMQCLVCGGKGCSVCKRSGWVEMMPGGPPHPNVMKAGGIDPEKWVGFYINIGLDRLVMMRHGIGDIRLLHSADLRFLNQFRTSI